MSREFCTAAQQMDPQRLHSKIIWCFSRDYGVFLKIKGFYFKLKRSSALVLKELESI